MKKKQNYFFTYNSIRYINLAIKLGTIAIIQRFNYFFLKNVKELCIIILRRKKGAKRRFSYLK